MTLSHRAAGMLGLLLVVALVLAALVSLLPAALQPVPLLLSPPFARDGAGPRAAAAPAVADAAPLPVGTPTAVPGAGRRPARTGGDLAPADLFFNIRRASAGGFTVYLASLLTLLLAGVVGLFLTPRRIGRIAGCLRGPWSERFRLGLLGLATGLVVAAAGVLALFTGVGIPIWVLLAVLGLVGAVLGLAGVSLPLGRWIGRRFGLAEQPAPVDLLAGLLVLFILNLLPFVGGALLLVAALLGLGAVIQTRAGSERPWTFDLPDLEY